MDMKKKIVRKIVIITMLALFVLCMFVAIITNYSNIKAASENVQNVSAVYERMLGGMSLEEIKDKFSNSNEEITRVVVFDSSGNVVVDSLSRENEIDNINGSKEFSEAMSGDSRTKIEIIQERREVWLNYTVKIRNGDFDGGFFLIRVGYLYSDDVFRFYFSVPIIIVALILFTILATVFTNKLIKTAVTPFEMIEESLEEINRGEYHQVTLNTKYEDINRVVKGINDVSSKIFNSLNYLKYEQRKNEFLLENIDQGVLAISKKGKIILANESVKEIFSFDKNVLGCDIRYMTGNEVFIENIDGAIADKSDKSFEMTLGEKVYRVNISRIDEKWFKDFRGIAIIVLISDITEEYNTSRIRSEFFANASHELKTPLTAIKGFSELMTAIDDKETRNKCIEEINKNSNRMLALIQDMLKLSKLDAKMIEEETSVIDLKKASEDIIESLKSLIDEKSLSVSVTGEGRILGRMKLIDEMITNIVGNAIKYNKEGGSIDVSISKRDGEVVFSVSDTGIGIPLKDQGRIFERFYIPDKGRNKKIMSTGLGLAIVKHIVLEHNAEISLESVEGEGTTIKVAFKETADIGDGKITEESNETIQ